MRHDSVKRKDIMSTNIERPVCLNGFVIEMSSALQLMDDTIREDVHERMCDIAPCTNQEFLDEYCRCHLEKYGEAFRAE